MLYRSVLGPALGGALAQPCESYPAVFARGTIFDRFPFLLPNLVCAVLIAFGVLIGLLFLEETHEELKYRWDFGIETRKWLVRHLQTRPAHLPIGEKSGDANPQEHLALLGDEEPPAYRTTEGSPCQPSSPFRSPNTLPADARTKGVSGLKRNLRGFEKAFTRQGILNIASLGLLA